MTKTVKEPITREEIIKDLQENLEDMPPQVLASHAIMLAGYLATMTTEIAKATKAYYIKWVEVRNYAHITTDGRAEHEAKATDEYYNKKKIEHDFKATTEMIHAIKKKLGFDEEEYKNTGG